MIKHAASIIVSILACIVTICSAVTPAYAAPAPLKRDILALWSSESENEIRSTLIHTMAEMPLNHLGYTLRYHDIDESIPTPDMLDDIHGVLIWLPPGTIISDAKQYLDWLAIVADRNMPITFLGSLGAIRTRDGKEVPEDIINAVFNRFGLEIHQDFIAVTYDLQFTHIDKELFQFESRMPLVLPGFQRITASGDEVKILLKAGHKEGTGKDSILAALFPSGGYVSEEYIYSEEVALPESQDENDNKDNEEEEEIETLYRQWYIDPFAFFSQIYDADSLPKPDTTTLFGKRIFYSHIDGDGWNNLTEVPPYKNLEVIAPEVILKEVLIPYSDLPVTVAPVAAELDTRWVGKRVSQDVAREIFALPQIEAATHTYTHPFQWGFFSHYSPEKEEQFLSLYRDGSWKNTSLSSYFKSTKEEVETDDVECPVKGTFSSLENRSKIKKEEGELIELSRSYDIPRAYARKPYSLELEICGSIAYISQFLPEGKSIKLVQWSGDTSPDEKVLAMTRQNGFLNINGGDTRFDPEYPSYSWVSPVGRQDGEERQIYASNSNENTYTETWSDRFYGFKYLLRTSYNTELPTRIKPFNIYYHMYSGEKLASLNALKFNMNHARIQQLHPIHTSHYSAIANGFYSTRITQLKPEQWRITDRGALQTIRMDNATLRTVDYSRSDGVLGHRHQHGSLYIALDPDSKSPIITTKDFTNFGKHPKLPIAYLSHSNWFIKNLRQKTNQIAYEVKGFGPGTMAWVLPESVDMQAVTVTINEVVNKTIENRHNSDTEDAHTGDNKKIKSRHNSATKVSYKVGEDGVLLIHTDTPLYEFAEIIINY